MWELIQQLLDRGFQIRFYMLYDLKVIKISKGGYNHQREFSCSYIQKPDTNDQQNMLEIGLCVGNIEKQMAWAEQCKKRKSDV